jgi:hypothetical protein
MYAVAIAAVTGIVAGDVLLCVATAWVANVAASLAPLGLPAYGNAFVNGVVNSAIMKLVC